ncbi:guanitoxin biosynthesis heme-dependent pre-guanitoxin N-hydroxylase GntA [Asticcacaulis sp. 201]|uniref:guanitoxin biosynthesis heme-dependent pre-guanitoxin N-hydroxylase GntA n=1 Tax=Asticcacaulis sp. 201 TaxID=3028787 RepID=UPI0029161144|nr:guanitoxin biosynthesis heme-dependent pre-guanitoxin N-hydroxylase GntA [Asticcacaulis sp. 201]MDV6330857.1 guanitoxin biosynthesis heme-dependent pre-guanitoxin N-hydroxylase GntA [Asticcacaulis sp. 201]
MFIKVDVQQECENDAKLVEKFEAKIKDKAFPCVGAKSALSRQRMQFLTVGDIRCPRDDTAIYNSLCDFARAYQAAPGPFQSFVVIFNTAGRLTEEQFESALWNRLQALEGLDAQAGHAYDPRVSADVDDNNFSLSFAGEAFFVVGLHPEASRPARKFDMPAVVFNAHDQFEGLRTEGKYETLRESIIQRDVALAGVQNPMLARFGETSEASQYSGRHVGADWKCPFQRVHS